MKKIIIFAILLFLVGLVVGQDKPLKERPLDELTSVKLQNIQLQIQLAQERAATLIKDYFARNGLKEEEWRIDLQRMVLVPVVKAEPEKKP